MVDRRLFASFKSSLYIKESHTKDYKALLILAAKSAYSKERVLSEDQVICRAINSSDHNHRLEVEVRLPVRLLTYEEFIRECMNRAYQSLRRYEGGYKDKERVAVFKEVITTQLVELREFPYTPELDTVIQDRFSESIKSCWLDKYYGVWEQPVYLTRDPTHKRIHLQVGKSENYFSFKQMGPIPGFPDLVGRFSIPYRLSNPSNDLGKLPPCNNWATVERDRESEVKSLVLKAREDIIKIKNEITWEWDNKLKSILKSWGLGDQEWTYEIDPQKKKLRIHLPSYIIVIDDI